MAELRHELQTWETLIGECFLECTCLTSDGKAREKMMDKSSLGCDCAMERVIVEVKSDEHT